MTPESETRRPIWPYAVAVLGAFLIVGALAWAMVSYTQPPPLNAGRAAERAAALSKMRTEDAEALQNPGWVDKAKGIVRLPIEDAVRIVEHDWGQTPAAARSNLITRVEKATAPPPKAPEKPSQFE